MVPNFEFGTLNHFLTGENWYQFFSTEPEVFITLFGGNLFRMKKILSARGRGFGGKKGVKGGGSDIN